MLTPSSETSHDQAAMIPLLVPTTSLAQLVRLVEMIRLHRPSNHPQTLLQLDDLNVLRESYISGVMVSVSMMGIFIQQVTLVTQKSSMGSDKAGRHSAS